MGVESGGGSGGFSLEAGAAWEFVTGVGAAGASTLALDPLSLTGCFSCSVEQWDSCRVSGKLDCPKRERELIQYHHHQTQRDLCAKEYRELRCHLRRVTGQN